MLVQQVKLPHEAEELGDLVEGLPHEEVHRRALAARRIHARAARALSFWLLEIEKRRLYREFGCSSVFQYAELHLELAPHTIAEYLRMAREMEHLPLLAEACARGEISPAKLREISRVATPETEKAWASIGISCTYRQVEKLVPLTPRGGLPPERALGKNCRTSRVASPAGELTVEDSGGCVGTGEKGKDRSTVPECVGAGERGKDCGSEGEVPCGGLIDAPACDERKEEPVRYSSKLVLELEHDRLALIRQAFSKARKETGSRERGALLEHISRRYLENDAAGSREGSPYRIIFHHIPGTSVTWAEGGAAALRIPPSALSEALCDAEILDLREDPAVRDSQAAPQVWAPMAELPREAAATVAAKAATVAPPAATAAPVTAAVHSQSQAQAYAASTEASALPVAASCSGRDHKALPTAEENLPSAALSPKDPARHGPRLRRTIPVTLRRQVFARDMHQCAVPGCTHRVYLSIHHIKYYAHGGEDRLGNLITICGSCHRALHRGMLSVRGLAPHRLVWSNARGEILKGSSP
jgi:hypothetical protein